MSAKDQTKKLSLGFSDNVSVFLNNKILFDGTLNHNRYEMTMFVDKGEGIYLNLIKGKNELVLALSEFQGGFGGWGFEAVLDNVNDIKFFLE